MIKIFLESDKFSHKAGVTKHATNTMARQSQRWIRSSDIEKLDSVENDLFNKLSLKIIYMPGKGQKTPISKDCSNTFLEH